MTLYTVTSEIFTENKNASVKFKNGSKFILLICMQYYIDYIIFLYNIVVIYILINIYVCNHNVFSDAISSFAFKCPSYMIKPKSVINNIIQDSDNDLDIDRQKEEKLLIGINKFPTNYIIYRVIFACMKLYINTYF